MISVSKLKNSYYISTNKELLLVLVLQVVLFKDVLIWIFNRLNDNSDEISGITSLISLFIILFLGSNYKDNNFESKKFDLNIISYTFLLYFFISFFDIAILKGLIASLSLSITASFYINRKYFDLKIFGLLLLSLPILTSLQFFIGYPLRILVTYLASILLKLSGLNVLQEATCLTLDKNSVCVDAPCSGIQMLLTGFFLCFIFSFIKKLNNIQTIILLVTNILIVIFVNIFRATALFYTESGILLTKVFSEEQIKTYGSTFKNFSHDSIGIVSFIFIALLIMFSCEIMKRVNYLNKFKLINKKFNFKLPINKIYFLIFTIFLLQITFLFKNDTSLNVNSKVINQPTFWEGKKLKSLPFSDIEKRFFSDFAGKTGRFTDGEHEIIIRQITSPTRKLHPASDCYKGIGYKISFLPIFLDKNNNKWNTFKAYKNNQSFIVHERVYDNYGNNWTDVSSWYWNALLGKSKGPWTSIVYSK